MIAVKCKNCGREQTIKPSRAKRYMACSVACRDGLRAKRAIAAKDTCAVCGRLYTPNGRDVCTKRCEIERSQTPAIKRLARKGLRSNEIAGELSISDGHVRRLCRKLGIKLGRKQMTLEQKAAARKPQAIDLFLGRAA